ncbi:MAG: hypothetical protein AB1498_02535 [bacterium]
MIRKIKNSLFTIFFFTLFIVSIAQLQTASARQVYLITDQNNGILAAYDLDSTSGLVLQPQFPFTVPQPMTGTSGLAVDENDRVLIVTYEMSGNPGFAIVDAQTKLLAGTVNASVIFDGVDIDDSTNIVYSCNRFGRPVPQLGTLNLDPVAKTMTQRPGSPSFLQSTAQGGFGIVTDEINRRLYIAHSPWGQPDPSGQGTHGQGSYVGVFDRDTLAEVGRIRPSLPCVGLAVDRVRGFLYTTAPDGYGPVVPGPSNTRLSKIDLATGVETIVDMGHGGMGIAIDESTGFVFVTGGCTQRNLTIWNSALILMQRIDNIGPAPAGIAIANPMRHNTAPSANAGDNLAIAGEDQNVTVIHGTASDIDNDHLTYRWLEGTTELCPSQDVGANGEAYLDLGTISPFSVGQHILTLEVSDGQAVTAEEMILTVENSSPHAAPVGAGTYEIGSVVSLGGQISDFDGDLVTYKWLEGGNLIFSGSIQAIYGGAPVALPEYLLYGLSLGTHTLTLSVNDGINLDVTGNIVVNIIDSTAPTLSPVPDKTILWPPNHMMTEITIRANAGDNSGLPVTLTAVVTSNEPINGLGDGDMAPDWTEPVIDENGNIYLDLRAERSGNGSGREYTITVTAADSSNNSSSAVLSIIVPHDMRKK